MTTETASQCRVRAMVSSDLELVLGWRNHLNVRSFMYTHEEITLETHQRWFDSAKGDARKYLLIFEVAGLPLGFVNFCETGNGRVADWGFYAAPDAPKGSGRQLGHTALTYAFNDLNLHKICGQALGYNERSIYMHQALGFVEEGVLHEQHFDGQRFHDVHQFGLLRAQWNAPI